MPFTLTGRPIDVAALMAGLGDTRAGACVTFEGRVRSQNDGRTVRGLDYEAYAPLAEREGEGILAEARGRFQIFAAVCVHRTGSLQLGDLAVWVAVTAGHRDAAFQACRYVIDETKARVPIWKKEHYADGSTEWINAIAGPGQGGNG